MSLPSQAQMMLPLLEVMATAGERIRPGQCYKLIADKLGVSAEERTKRVPNGTSTRMRMKERFAGCSSVQSC